MGQRQALVALQVTDHMYKEGKITKEERERIGNAFLDRLCKSLPKIKETERQRIEKGGVAYKKLMGW